MMSELKLARDASTRLRNKLLALTRNNRDMADLQRSFQNRLDEMEEEMKDLRAGRSASPAPHRAGSTGRGCSPRSTTVSWGYNQPIIDDLQIVRGGLERGQEIRC